jgi:hypothetical protein
MAKKETTYDEAQINDRLKELPGWYRRMVGYVASIRPMGGRRP